MSAKLPIIVPSRYYAQNPDGSTYSLTAMTDFIARAGFDGIDLSLELTDMNDDGRFCVLNGFARRARDAGLSVPMCHLPFYMPSPDDRAAMTAFFRLVDKGLSAASGIGIPVAVLHPVVRHSRKTSYRDWLSENIAYLGPLAERAGRLGVRLAIENMTGVPCPGVPDDIAYGSRQSDVLVLAKALDTGICWDFGHAHLSGVELTPLPALASRLTCVHLHDNDGFTDTHLIPGEGGIDWKRAMTVLKDTGYLSHGPGLDFEIKGSDLPRDDDVRTAHAARALYAARKLAGYASIPTD